jgi:hypothetical protein
MVDHRYRNSDRPTGPGHGTVDHEELAWIKYDLTWTASGPPSAEILNVCPEGLPPLFIIHMLYWRFVQRQPALYPLFVCFFLIGSPTYTHPFTERANTRSKDLRAIYFGHPVERCRVPFIKHPTLVTLRSIGIRARWPLAECDD